MQKLFIKTAFHFFRSSKIKATFGFFLLSLATVSVAQDPFYAHIADIRILQAKIVQKAIGLTESQRTKLNQYATVLNGQLKTYEAELAKTKARPDPNRIASFEVPFQKKVFAELSPTQMQRLAQISLQRDGIAAMADNVVAKRLGLSSSQIQKIRDTLVSHRNQLNQIEQKATKPVIDKYRNRKPKSQKEAEQLEHQLRTEMNLAVQKYAPQVKSITVKDRAKIISQLSPKQQALWNTLLGKDFKG